MDNNFEVCVRGIIVKDGKILVCKNKAKDYYFFPGGHVEFGERAENALIRELKEELNLSLESVSFIGANENVFTDDGIHHEINLVFEVKATEAQDKSMEDHLDFFFFDKKRFNKEKILPIAIKKSVAKWLSDRKIFWSSQIKK